MFFERGLLEYGLEEERVLGEALHGLNQDVHQAQSLALLLRLTPLQQEKGKGLIKGSWMFD